MGLLDEISEIETEPSHIWTETIEELQTRIKDFFGFWYFVHKKDFICDLESNHILNEVGDLHNSLKSLCVDCECSLEIELCLCSQCQEDFRSIQLDVKDSKVRKLL